MIAGGFNPMAFRKHQTKSSHIFYYFRKYTHTATKEHLEVIKCIFGILIESKTEKHPSLAKSTFLRLPSSIFQLAHQNYYPYAMLNVAVRTKSILPYAHPRKLLSFINISIPGFINIQMALFIEYPNDKNYGKKLN